MHAPIGKLRDFGYLLAMPLAPHNLPLHLPLLAPLILLAAAVVAVPVFRQLRLGSVVGYLAAGIVIGPYGLALFADPQSISSVAELGVVLLLFIIGLELKPSRLWTMRRDIFGFGLTQVIICGGALAAFGLVCGLDAPAAVITGLGLALSSTAFALPLMQERGALTAPFGQRAFAVLLLQDLAIVPLLALVALLAPGGHAKHAAGLTQTLAMLAAVGSVAFFARYILNPLFGILAQSKAREIMTAAALLVVLGAATVMELVGLSMAMGAFLAGVLLAESNFRHELAADIEPFRGILLGLFFITVGMGIELNLVAAHLSLVAAIVLGLMSIKALLVYVTARLSGSPNPDALRVAGLLAQGGEFAFVLFAAAARADVLEANQANLLIASVTISLALTPIAYALAERLARRKREVMPDADFSDAHSRVMVIGFGRFGQVVSQLLMAQGIEVTAIERDVEAIRAATRFGFRVYYGDGTRLDVLRAAGAEDADVIAICVDDKQAALKIVDIARLHFPLAKLYVRAIDRRHALELLRRDVDYQLRETFESAMAFGHATLEALGVSIETASQVEADMRRRDAERLVRQQTEGMQAGSNLMHTRPVQPEPLTLPKGPGRALNPEAEEMIKSDASEGQTSENQVEETSPR